MRLSQAAPVFAKQKQSPLKENGCLTSFSFQRLKEPTHSFEWRLLSVNYKSKIKKSCSLFAINEALMKPIRFLKFPSCQGQFLKFFCWRLTFIPPSSRALQFLPLDLCLLSPTFKQNCLAWVLRNKPTEVILRLNNLLLVLFDSFHEFQCHCTIISS